MLSPEQQQVTAERPDQTGLSLSPDEVKEEIRYKANLPAFWVRGFEGPIKDGSVVGTIAKKRERVGDIENRNQDNLILDPRTGLFGVTDGLGEKEGSKTGADASAVLADDFPQAYEDALTAASILDANELVEHLADLQRQKYGQEFPGLKEALEERVRGIMAIDPAMAEKAFALLNAAVNVNQAVKETGGKVTLCVGLIHVAPDGSKWHVSINVGDSRAFKYKKETREVTQLTMEDSLLNLLTTRGILRPEDLERLKQDPTATFNLGKKSLTYGELKRSMIACLGGDDQLAIPSLSIRRVKPGDTIVLGTDGLEKKMRATGSEDMDLDKLRDITFPENNSDKVRVDASLPAALDLLREYQEPDMEDDDIALVAATIE